MLSIGRFQHFILIAKNYWTIVHVVPFVVLMMKVVNAGTLGLVVLGPVLVLATYLVLGPFNLGVTSTALRFVLLADLVYVLVVAALVKASINSAFLTPRGFSTPLAVSTLFAPLRRIASATLFGFSPPANAKCRVMSF